jgi:hypothetical protein
LSVPDGACANNHVGATANALPMAKLIGIEVVLAIFLLRRANKEYFDRHSHELILIKAVSVGSHGFSVPLPGTSLRKGLVESCRHASKPPNCRSRVISQFRAEL